MTNAGIIAARDFAAFLVAEYGEAYLPVFERMEDEVAKLDLKAAAVSGALRGLTAGLAPGSLLRD